MPSERSWLRRSFIYVSLLIWNSRTGKSMQTQSGAVVACGSGWEWVVPAKGHGDLFGVMEMFQNWTLMQAAHLCVFTENYCIILLKSMNDVAAQSLCRVWLFATPRTAARQASLSFTISRSLFRLSIIESVMPFNHTIITQRELHCYVNYTSMKLLKELVFSWGQ